MLLLLMLLLLHNGHCRRHNNISIIIYCCRFWIFFYWIRSLSRCCLRHSTRRRICSHEYISLTVTANGPHRSHTCTYLHHSFMLVAINNIANDRDADHGRCVARLTLRHRVRILYYTLFNFNNIIIILQL